MSFSSFDIYKQCEARVQAGEGDDRDELIVAMGVRTTYLTGQLQIAQAAVANAAVEKAKTLVH